MLLGNGKIIKVRQGIPAGACSDALDICRELVSGSADEKANLEIALLDPALRDRTMALVADLYRSKLFEGLRQLTSGQPVLIATFCTARYQSPHHKEGRIAWHFDANFIGWDAAAATCWIALEDAGVERPGLEFCISEKEGTIRRLFDAWAARQVVGNTKRAFTDAALDDLVGADRRSVTPELAAGDVLVFGPSTLHRTQVGIRDPKPRMSLEIRFYDSDRVPPLLERTPIFTLLQEQSPGRISVMRQARAPKPVGEHA